jgi:hypothetical protein
LLVRRELGAELQRTRGRERIVGRLLDLFAGRKLVLRIGELVRDRLEIREHGRREHRLRDAVGHSPTLPVLLMR